MLLAAGLLLTLAAPALAHADFVSSTPPDGATLAEAPGRFELLFTEAVEPVPGGTRLTGDDGAVQFTLFQPSDDVVVIEPSETLPDGRYELIWEVESADTHRTDGVVAVTVGAGTEDEGSDSAIDAPTHDAPAEARGADTTLPMLSEDLPAFALASGPVETDIPGSPAGDWVARVGRWALMAGALLATGALVFAGTALVGTEEEVRLAMAWVRRGGILVLVGTIIEVVGVLASRAGFTIDAFSRATLVDLLASSFGLAVLLRLAGGIALLQDPLFATVRAESPPQDDGTLAPVIGPLGRDEGAVVTAPPMERFRLVLGQEWLAIAGVLTVAASFMFDGHTVSVEHSTIAKGASFIHVLAAGVWVGGLVAMAATLIRRRRRHAPLDTAEMAIRFSRAAAAALTGAAVAGLALTWTIVESPSDLVSSTWGRLLVAKVALVAAAALLGGYNHFKVVPELDANPAEAAVSDRFRNVVVAEVGVLLAVVAMTAILVSATP